MCQSHSLLVFCFCAYWCVDGKACPAATALEEWRVCNNHPCVIFHWETSPWGLCIENVSIDLNVTSLGDVTSTCPVGVQIRKVRCMKSNSGPVISKRSVAASISSTIPIIFHIYKIRVTITRISEQCLGVVYAENMLVSFHRPIFLCISTQINNCLSLSPLYPWMLLHLIEFTHIFCISTECRLLSINDLLFLLVLEGRQGMCFLQCQRLDYNLQVQAQNYSSNYIIPWWWSSWV